MYSDIKMVQQKADKYNIKVFPSDRKNKKYFVISKNKKTYFGDPSYADFTGHKDEVRRQNFLSRNRAWKNAPRQTPAWLSYHLLW